MPFSNEQARARLREEARRGRPFGEAQDDRQPARHIDGPDYGRDEVLFTDVTDQTIIGVDSVIGTMTT